MRTRHKMWRNAGGGKWTARITWYEDGDDIRLKMEDEEGVVNFYPESRDEANEAWDRFKDEAQSHVLFAFDLVRSLEKEREGRKLCSEVGHDWDDHSYANHNSGCIDMTCKRCGISCHTQLY